jgi:hypothetical protein
MNAPTRHKRGELSPCGTLRFWQYQKYVPKKTGKPCERWIPVENYERYSKQVAFNNTLGSARSDFIKSQQAKIKAKRSAKNTIDPVGSTEIK